MYRNWVRAAEMKRHSPKPPLAFAGARLSRILRIPTPVHTPMASQYGTRHTNGTLVRKPRPVRQMAANGFLLPNVMGAMGIANPTPPEHNPLETMRRERTT